MNISNWWGRISSVDQLNLEKLPNILKIKIDQQSKCLKMASCIFCEKEHFEETVEHIVPRSLGNIHYILARGLVCRKCNNRFAKYENDVLSSPVFLKERQRLGLIKTPTHINGKALNSKTLYPFLTKIGFEAIYRSRQELWRKYDWSAVRAMMVQGNINPVIKDMDDSGSIKTKSIPRWINTFRLGRNHLRLLYSQTDDERLFFHFQFGVIKAKVRLI